MNENDTLTRVMHERDEAQRELKQLKEEMRSLRLKLRDVSHWMGYAPFTQDEMDELFNTRRWLDTVILGGDK